MPLSAPTRTALLALVIGCTVIAVYWPGLNGGFRFDDDANIVNNPAVHIETLSRDSLRGALHSGISGPLGRPVSMLSFALDHYLHGLEPWWFKLTNLSLHVLNGLLIWLLTRQLLTHAAGPGGKSGRGDALALAIAAVWLLHPLQASSVLYVVQRMTLLATCFSLLALNLYVYGRLRPRDPARRALFVVLLPGLAAALAVLSKETALLIPIYGLVIEITVLHWRFPESHRPSRWLYGLYCLAVLVPGLAVAGYLVLHPEWFEAAYRYRDYDVLQRLLTQSRVLIFYLRLIVFPHPSHMALFHDDIAVSTSALAPPSTAISITAILGLLAAAALAVRRSPWFAFGVFWFFGGHLLESTIYPLELVYEHRNYLPSLGPLAAIVIALHRMLGASLRTALSIAAIALFGFIVLLRAQHWGAAPAVFYVAEAVQNPASPRASYFAGWHLTNLGLNSSEKGGGGRLRTGLDLLERSIRLDPDFNSARIAILCTRLDAGERAAGQLVEELRNSLANAPPDAANLNSLRLLNECAGRHLDTFPARSYALIVDSFLGNPILDGVSRRQAYLYAANYFGRHRRDFDTAARYLSDAERYGKHPDILIARAGWLVLDGDYQQAHRDLDTLRRLPLDGTQARRAERLRAVLERVEAGPGLSPSLAP